MTFASKINLKYFPQTFYNLFLKATSKLFWKWFIQILKGSDFTISTSTKQKSLRKKCPYSEFFWSVFSSIRMNTERYGVSLRIQFKCGKIRCRETGNTDSFYAVSSRKVFMNQCNLSVEFISGKYKTINFERMKTFSISQNIITQVIF